MLTLTIHAIVSLFAVMNPLGNVPIFLSVTDGYSLSDQRQTAKKAVLVSFIILTLFLLLGHVIFHLFGITINAFRVAGGILIFTIAYRLLHAKPSHMQHPHEEEHQESIKKDDVSVTPLATPILAGPGTIATVMALSAASSVNGSNLLTSSLSVFIGFAAVLLLTYIVFHYSTWISTHLGQTELNVITRLMGLILAVIAVQMASEGLLGLFPVLNS